MKNQGKIKVNTEDLFPIIKKWLYSDKDIFLRELISNSCDAIKKLQHLNSIENAGYDDLNGRIDVKIDKKNKTIVVSDNGIGMTYDEVEKYITQIAFSGAKEFIEKYKDKADVDSGIIGHFGLGFYSVFVVSDFVEIDTLSYVKDAEPVHWLSHGKDTYDIELGLRKNTGTTITLHINQDSEEFLQENKLRSILTKYCQFMPYEIFFNQDTNPINNTKPLWLKAPKDCKKEDYENFYKEVFMDFEPPLFWIHLNVDYPFNLKGILYFPKNNNKVQIIPGEVKLYCNQVYVADNIKEVIPEFLMLLKGVIDCPDIPLNVSRSFLQNDGNIIKITNHITKKVSDKLHKLFKDDRQNFEKYWNDISPFIKFGCIKDEKFYNRIKDIIIFKTIYSDFKTLEELNKQNNDQKIYYVTDENLQSQYVNMFKDNNLHAIILDHDIDNHFISFLEFKNNKLKFNRIDSDIADGIKVTDQDKNLEKNILEIFKSIFNQSDIVVKAENLNVPNLPAIILLSEYERRMNEMSNMYGQILQNKKSTITLILNLKNDVIKMLPDIPENKRELFCKQIYDIAMINHKQLSAKEMSEFITRSLDILKIAANNGIKL